MNNLNVSRRTVAKGAMWSVPAVAVAGGAPAMAASGITLAWSACNMDCSANQVALSGRTANGANLYVDAGFTAGAADIPVGTTVSWTDSFWVKSSDAATQLGIHPANVNDTYGTLSVASPVSGATQTYSGVAMTQISYTVTYTVNKVIPAGSHICNHTVWTSSGYPAYLRSNTAYPAVTISGLSATGATVTAAGGYTSAAIPASTSGVTCL